ncbi:MAG: 16S rRNA (cytidine(1402)-2'-O)-methyltransferase [Muribaculaceae bacterium]|nr:16S rRNA (cytidine(1402)-2'-O)-methyltransferase [Muribaculaceae bacterium]
MSGKLYMVPTPVGNLADMSPRAIEVLRQVNLILAEDTRTSGVLMKHFGIETPMMSHHKFNEHSTLAPIMDRLMAGETIALVTDAGTPGISDPGFLLTRECRRLDIVVETLPGPTAFVPALVNSGLPCERFCFEGFLPVKKGRATRLEELAADSRTTIIYESPLRLVKTLMQLMDVCGGEREASVSREISKKYDTTVRGTLSELVDFFKENNPKGEIVIVLSGKKDDIEKPRHRNKYKLDEE